MPELPEVETVVRGLRRAGIRGLPIKGARIRWSRTLDNLAPTAFDAAVRGTSIRKIERRAKYIVIHLSSELYLLMHLRMTGSLSMAWASLPHDPAERAALQFANGRELRFRDTRKFGRWYLLEKPDEILGHLGPEPLSDTFTPEWFEQALKKHRRALKPLLLDQSFLAGLGNIYVDEALFAAGLHPCRIACTLQTAAVRRLYASIQAVLRSGIERRGTSLGQGTVNFYSVAGRRGRNQDALQVFRRDGEPCPICGRTIERLIVGQRSTHVCRHCQPPPRKVHARAGSGLIDDKNAGA